MNPIGSIVCGFDGLWRFGHVVHRHRWRHDQQRFCGSGSGTRTGRALPLLAITPSCARLYMMERQLAPPALSTRSSS